MPITPFDTARSIRDEIHHLNAIGEWPFPREGSSSWYRLGNLAQTLSGQLVDPGYDPTTGAPCNRGAEKEAAILAFVASLD